MRRYPAAGAILVLLLLVAGCARSDLTLSSDRVGGRLDPSHRGPDLSDADPDQVVEVALDDLQAYWSDAYPDLYGGSFRPLGGGYVPYGPTTPVPSCGSDAITYEDVAANALYCPDEDLIAWDRVALIPT